MRGHKAKPRAPSPGVCSDSSRSPMYQSKTLKGKSSSRPAFNVKASTNKKKLGLSKGSKRKKINEFPSSTSMNYNGPSTSQQVVVSPKYDNLQKEASNQYVKLTGPKKAVASGQTKIYSTPPNAPMKKDQKQKKKNTATSTSGRKFNDSGQQILKISDFEPSSQKVTTKSSRNITSLSKVEMRNKGQAYDECEKPAGTGRPKYDTKVAPRSKSPGTQLRGPMRPEYTTNSTRNDPSDQRITSNKANSDYQKITIDKAKSRSKIPPPQNSATRGGMITECDPSQLITTDSSQQKQTYMYDKSADHSQLIGTSGQMVDERQLGIKVICQNKGDRTPIGSMSGAPSSQAIDTQKVFYQETQGLEAIDSDNVYEITEISDYNRDHCIPEEQALEYGVEDEMKVDIECREMVQAQAINGPQGRTFYRDADYCKGETAPNFDKDEYALQTDSSSKCVYNQDRERSAPREVNPQSKFRDQSNASQPHRTEKSVCKDKGDRSKAEIDSRSQFVGQGSKDELRAVSKRGQSPSNRVVGQTSSQPELKRKKTICKDKSQTKKSRVENDSNAQLIGQGSPRGRSNSPTADNGGPAKSRGETDGRGKIVCKDKSQVKEDRSAKDHANKESGGQPDRRSKVVCKDGKNINSPSTLKKGEKSAIPTTAKSDPSKESLYEKLGRSNSKVNERRSLNKSPKKDGMSMERKILYGTVAVATLLVLGGLVYYYMNMNEFD